MIKFYKDMKVGIRKPFANEPASRIDTGSMKTRMFFLAVTHQQLLAKEQLDISEIGALICSTGTPLSMTSACRVLNELSPEKGEVLMQAHDVNAACSGYLYALQSAFDFISNLPKKLSSSLPKRSLLWSIETIQKRILSLEMQRLHPSFAEERPGSIGVKLNRPVCDWCGAKRFIRAQFRK